MRCRLKFGLCVVGSILASLWNRAKHPLKTLAENAAWLFGGLAVASVVAIGVGKLWTLILGNFYGSFSIWFGRLDMCDIWSQYWILGMLTAVFGLISFYLFYAIISAYRITRGSLKSIIRDCVEHEDKRRTE